MTSLEFWPAEIWRLYRGRGDAENRIKELKQDFGFDSFNLNGFYPTEAALTFAIGAYFEKVKDKLLLRIALTKKQRKWF